MFLEEDLLGTPRQRYCKLRGEFRRKYLNHKCWKVPSFDDLLRYLEKTDQLCDLDPSLRKDVTANNINLVLNDMPFPKYPDELYDCVKVSHSQVGILWKTKEYFEKKRSGLFSLEQRCGQELHDRCHLSSKVEKEQYETGNENCVKNIKNKNFCRLLDA